MISLVIEQYLDSVKDERAFDFPFMALLHEMGFYDIHFTHDMYEFGKDFIAKKEDDDQTIQYVIQSKAKDVDLSTWRREIQSQLTEAITNTLSHPNFDAELERKPYS